MLRTLTGLILTFLLLVPGAAAQRAGAAAQQSDSPDYVISNARVFLSNNNSEIRIEFQIGNIGRDANQEVSVVLLLESTGRVIAEDKVPPLPRGETAVARFVFPVGGEDFPFGTTQQVRVEVGIGEIEAVTSPTVFNNRTVINVNVPRNGTGSGDSTVSPLPTQTTPVGTGAGQPEVTSDVVRIPLLGLELGLKERERFVSILLTGLAAFLLFWLITVILRLMFRRPPAFGNVSPPYAHMPPLDPNTIGGRRQLWQQHAQNGSVFVPCRNGTGMQVVKLLQGIDGVNLSGWQIKAVQMSHYDMYGRVARSQILGSSSLIKRLNTAARRSGQWPRQKLEKRLRPVAGKLAKAFRKKLDKRNTMLPVALDIRFEGRHGEVRILFELYRCEGWVWLPVDQWEPDMRVMGSVLSESYTYTLHGQLPNETTRDFHQRLEKDLLWLLTEMLKRHPVDMVPPDTLSDMKPVSDVATKT